MNEEFYTGQSSDHICHACNIGLGLNGLKINQNLDILVKLCKLKKHD